MEPDISNINVTQRGNGIEVGDIFKTLKELRDAEKEFEYTKRTNKSKIFNRFSGAYFSPTFVKGFIDCPAKTFLSSCFPRTFNPIANFGSCSHKVFERIVVDEVQLDIERCLEIADEEIKNFSITGSNIKVLKEKYIPNLVNSADYLNNSKSLDWKNIEMFSEYFYKSEITALGVPLGPCYTLIDRLDIRDEGIFVFDYKTGPAPYNSQKLAEFIESYTDQMIVYSWQIEQQYGVKPKSVFAYIVDNNSYVEFPVKSLKLQSMLVEKILRYYKEIKEQRGNGYFEQRVNQYCKYCPIKDICNQYNKTDNDIQIKLDLTKI